MNKRRKEKKKMSKIVYLLLSILIFLVLLGGFLLNKNKENTGNNSLYTEDIEDYTIASSYGNLLFPEKWNEYIKTEIVKDDEKEIIQFWVEFEGKDRIHVFDIIFGGEGYKIGTIKIDDNKEVDVYIESYSYKIDDSWSDEEIEIINSIDHDINYLLEKLNGLDNFTPA